MRRKGKIVHWNNSKGFGFIAPSIGGEQLFFHIKHFKSADTPSVGQVISYDVSRDMQGRICAVDVLGEGETELKSENKISYSFSLIIVFLFAVFLLVSTLFANLPIGIAAYYIVVSLATYIAYASDKSASQRGEWRVSENILHMLSLLGGWPGALAAQQKLRHKTKKRSFRIVFWVTVCINIIIFFKFFGEAIFLHL